jgi:hypothetical protein
VEWLEDLLESKGGRVASAEAKRLGKAAGHNETALKRAKQRLGLSAESEGFPRVTHWVSPVGPQSDHLLRGDGLTDPTDPTALSQASRASQASQASPEGVDPTADPTGEVVALCACGNPISSMRVSYGKTLCLGCERRASA